MNTPVLAEEHRLTYQLCEDIGCRVENLSRMMDDRDGWKKRVREFCAKNST